MGCFLVGLQPSVVTNLFSLLNILYREWELVGHFLSKYNECTSSSQCSFLLILYCQTWGEVLFMGHGPFLI